MSPFRVMLGIALILTFSQGSQAQQPSSRFQQAQTLSFDELVELASIDPPPPAIARKLDALLTTPFINNGAVSQETSLRLPTIKGVGPVLRVAEWNINRGEDEDHVALALSDATGFLAAARQNVKLKRKDLAAVGAELTELQGADIVVLDEVDRGVRRTKYHDVARDLAQKLGMNYVYAVEFIELNRIYLGVKRLDAAEPTGTAKEGGRFGLDPDRYLGLEGSAILSHYPIRTAKIVRLPQKYDWYHDEINAVSTLERARRWSAEKLFDERIRRQIRRGGRIALVADLEVAQSPTGIVTVVCPHLEDYVGPKGRREQMDALLDQIRGNENPLILAGDLNTTGSSARPVTVRSAIRKYLLNYRFWIRQVVFLLAPVPGLGYAFRAANYIKNYHDPTAFSVPILLSNPSRHLFRNVSSFRFNDGGRFDFDARKRTAYHGRGRTLSDSNQRAWKGFTPTYSFQRTFKGLVGRYKIDWFFVKPPVSPGTEEQNRLLTPWLGRTLSHMNTALGPRISDHSPITVSLPLSSSTVSDSR